MIADDEVVRVSTAGNLSAARERGAVSVAIVSYNTREHLRACLESVLAEGPSEIVVVDNASTDDTPDMVRKHYPKVTLLANMANRGYAAAANQAIKSSRGAYVLLLNGDTTVTPGAIAALSSYMHRNPEAAVVGPLLRCPKGTVQRSYFPFPGTLRWLVENKPAAWLLHCLPVGRQRFLCLTPPTVDRVVPWVHGAAMMLRRTAVEMVGGFQESYFMYFEEVDLCWRLGVLQSQVHFTPTATVLHAGGASTSQCRTEMLIAHFRSAASFYRRHYSTCRASFWMALMRLKIVLRLARDLVRLRLKPGERERAILLEQIEAWNAILRGQLDRFLS